MKTKIMLLLTALGALLSVAIYSNQQARAEFSDLPQLAEEINALTAEAEALNVDVDEMLASIPIPDLDWKWVKVNGGDWAPSELDVIMMQRQVQSYVEQQAREQGIEAAEWMEFVFQYQGRIYEEQKYIIVRGNCHLFDEGDLEIGFIDVLDGGSCYFGVKFDPISKTFYDGVFFNGEA